MTGEGGQPLLRLTGLSKRFGDHLAVDDVTLDIGAGEFLCLLGPSGCGKSTLLRLLAGLGRADAGRVSLGGRDITDVPPHRRPINMMFQSYALFPHLTVAGNVGYGLRTEGLRRAEVAERTEAMLRLVSLEGFGGRYPAQLSGGQRQRVALARALARRPRVLLLDEPLAALDRSLRASTQVELKRLQARLGTTFVVVTHDQDEAMTMADRIGIMAGGRLVQVGSPRDVYERPANRFVAGFMGDANIFEGSVAACEGAVCRVALSAGIEAMAGCGPESPMPGRHVAVALHPENVTMTRCPEGDGGGLIGALVDIAFVGGSTLAQVALPDGQIVRVRQRDAEAGLGPGDRVALRLAAGSGWLLTT